ncbi:MULTISPECIES: HIT family protein [unclassified Rhodococcus (in: high G+C Gram-positive bacteria)]|uniref:HIT family protein n=1 Tax=Rhodococcus sp. IEGM 1341 TaxID=3047090 RepID=UPI0011EDB5EA|nr:MULTISPECIES: HIT family protein [unclassified Rhodococcus (in: high G+C Gram-positive bacteria)]KAA0921965.1 HIT family protein [Rhodococcus sp. ANT_H53B]MDI9928638.1 HIT family protein [Rhodococcus sp. IEGM 1341]
MEPCIFCAIVAGDAPAHRVFENDHAVAFLDIRPVTRGHLLVVPRQHATDLNATHPDAAADVFRVGHTLARAVRHSDLRADGANLVINDGKAAFQTVFHLHLHVVPRWHRDRFRFAAGFVTRRLSEPERVADAVRVGLARLDGEPTA